MFRVSSSVLAAAAVLLAGSMALAQGVETEVKTPPMSASETITLPVAIHTLGVTNWAGAIMRIHIVDENEVDIPGFAALPQYTQYGGGAVAGNSNVATVTLVHSLASQSGITVPASINIGLGNIEVHANGSTGQNSDFDVSIAFSNIFHIPGGPGSQIITLHGSDRIWVNSTQDIGQLHIFSGPYQSFFRFPEPQPLDNPNGHWLHLPEGSWQFHLSSGPGSNYFATFLNTARLGVEHVPEPAAAVLMLAGLGCAVAGRLFRNRRKAELA